MKPYPRPLVHHYTSNFRAVHFKKVGGNTVTNLQVIVMVNLLHSANLAKSLEGETERFSMINEMSLEFVQYHQTIQDAPHQSKYKQQFYQY